MDNIRRLLMLGALIIETFGLGAPAEFATSSHTSYAPKPSHVTKAHNGEARTDYYADGGYQVYNESSDGIIGTYFFRKDNPNFPIYFTKCTEGVGKSCPEKLPRELLTGELCMKTGVGQYDQPPNDYTYGSPECWK